MEKKKLLITREIPHTALRILEEYKEIEIDYRKGAPLSEEEMKKAIEDCDAVIPVIPDHINEAVLKAGKKLKIVAHYAVGYDNIDIKTATDLGIYVSNTPGNLTESVAEFALGLMFAISKRIVDADEYTRQGNYKYWDPMIFLGPKMMDKTLGIVGLGRIGSYLAKIAKYGLNMKIIYFDFVDNKEMEKELGAVKVSLQDLLQNSDFVSLNCPLTKDTKHLIGENELQLMKPTAYLINTARGPVVNEAALYTALEKNYIAGAALDVFENEPAMHEGLEKLPNVILTPHIASATREARIEMATMAANNVIDVIINGNPPTNLVNKEILEKGTSSLV